MAKKSKKKAADTEEAGGGKKKKVIAGGLVLVIAAAAWFFLLRSPSAATPVDAKPVPGAVVALDPITINLAGGHFLRVGLGLQVAEGESLAGAAGGSHGGESAATATADGDVKAHGAKALDAAIDVFSGKSVTQLSGTGRSKAREQLVKTLQTSYHGAVMDVYFTEFVMQ
jgi:flagellar FliL protein